MLVNRGVFPSRTKAVAAIMAGDVSVNGSVATKPGQQVYISEKIDIVDRSKEYVSRGGKKLEKALDIFGIDVTNRVVLDGGASTGGFTDCLLSRGAIKVIAVDVGYGQLDWKLRNDPRVEVLEKTNLRYLKPEDITEKATLSVIDISFISVLKVIPAIKRCLEKRKEIVVLVKPHFEIGKGRVGKGGIVKDPNSHKSVLKELAQKIAEEGLSIKALTFSPLLGAKGNIEFLLYLDDSGQGLGKEDIDKIIEETVSTAHKNLNEARKGD